jgi:hypothetical protein
VQASIGGQLFLQNLYEHLFPLGTILQDPSCASQTGVRQVKSYPALTAQALQSMFFPHCPPGVHLSETL